MTAWMEGNPFKTKWSGPVFIKDWRLDSFTDSSLFDSLIKEIQIFKSPDFQLPRAWGILHWPQRLQSMRTRDFHRPTSSLAFHLLQ